MRPYRIVNIIALGMLLLAGSLPVSAQGARDEIRALLVERDASIKKLLGPEGSEVSKANKEKLRDVVNGFLDFQAMSQAALGTHWSGLTAQQQKHFVDVFSDIVRGQSLSNLDPYRARVSYETITVNGSKAHVVTRTELDDVRLVVEYDLHRKGDRWLAVDIVLDEVSTVEGYSRSFQTMIRKKGFDTLMERLEKRRQELSA